MTKTTRINFKQINELTADNMHTEALWVLAKNLRDAKWQNILESASNEQNEVGYLTTEIKQIRTDARCALLGKVLEQMGEEMYVKVCQSL